MLHVSIPKESSSGNSKTEKKNLLCVIQNYDKPIMFLLGYAVALLVEALRYNPEGRGFDSRRCHWNFSLTLSLTQPLTEMSTRNISWGVKAAGAKG
jgi:hypothetical protein